MQANQEPVLCYVSGDWAYFTTQELSEQWGDDWNDAPYEYNAGRPYTFDEFDRKAGKKPWQIVKIAFDCCLEAVTYANNSCSVEEINRKAVPWLQPSPYGPMLEDKEGQPIQIWAGTTYSEFIRLIHMAKGEVYLNEAIRRPVHAS